MIKKCTDEDISDEELEKVINPFYDNYYEYVCLRCEEVVVEKIKVKVQVAKQK